MQSLGGARRARNHVDRGRAGATQIFVRQIQQALVVGVGVDGGHGAALDTKSVLDDFGDRREAISGAGGVRNDVMLCRIVALVVHAEDKGGVGTVRGCGDDDFLHGRAQMLLGIRAPGEQAGGFNNDFRANRSPVELRRVLRAEYPEGFAVYRDAVFRVGHLMRQIAEHGIVFQQMRERFGVRDVVHRDELNILVVDRRPHDVASNTAEAVNADLDGHAVLRTGIVDFRAAT